VAPDRRLRRRVDKVVTAVRPAWLT